MLTPAQQVILKAYIVADPTLNDQPYDGDGLGYIRDHLNAIASPDFIVWKTSTTSDEYRQAILETTGAATQLDALTASKRDSLLWSLSANTRPSIAATRAAIDDFCGSQNTLKAALTSVHKRPARVIEKILATGTGSDAVPATMDFEGVVDSNDVDSARRS